MNDNDESMVYADWFIIQKRMDEAQETNSARIRGILFLVHECKEAGKKITEWPNEYPNRGIVHGALVPLIARSFRHCLAVLRVSLSGYPDSAVVLIRSIWEIRVRLAIIKNDPLDASLVFLWAETEKNIKFLKESIPDVKGQNTNGTTSELETLQAERNERNDLLIKYSVVQKKINRYKEINYRNECEKLGLHGEYEGYPLYSEIAHGKYFADRFFMNETEGLAQVNIYPVKIGCTEAVQEALLLHTKCLLNGAEIIGDENLEKECCDVRDRMKNIWEKLEKKA